MINDYPLISDYDLAVSNLNTFVKAPQFIGGSPLYNQKQICAFSGAYSVVYPISVRGRKMALRCWIKNPGNVKERYKKVKSYLDSNPTKYFVDFGYVDNGIVAKGIICPVSYMDWIEGKTLSQFIEENIDNVIIIKKLADKFKLMVSDLHIKKIAHGDLQDGNIIVCKNYQDFELKLVDYDSLYTPSLHDLIIQDDLMGVPDYQHPKRNKKVNEKADYFSELVIYLSLLVYAEKPSLWKKGQEKKLLFTEKDFKNPLSVKIFKELDSFSMEIKTLSNALKNFCCENNTDRLVPLEQILHSTVHTTTTFPDYFNLNAQKKTQPPLSSPTFSELFNSIQQPQPPSSSPTFSELFNSIQQPQPPSLSPTLQSKEIILNYIRKIGFLKTFLVSTLFCFVIAAIPNINILSFWPFILIISIILSYLLTKK